MPAIHGSLTNEQFKKAMSIADRNGVELKIWVTSVIVSAIEKESRDEFISKDGNPIIPQYERQ